MKISITLWKNGQYNGMENGTLSYKDEKEMFLQFQAAPDKTVMFEQGMAMAATPTRWSRHLWHEVGGERIVTVCERG